MIRGIWGQAGPSVRVDGKHYQVRGAKVGPEPAHDIGIWVGAYKPRMLRLIGRLADGWLPTLGYVQPDQLPEMNKLIDDAARQGRPGARGDPPAGQLQRRVRPGTGWPWHQRHRRPTGPSSSASWR